MTTTSTPSDVVNAQAMIRDAYGCVARCVADLHGAYGKGVDIDISTRQGRLAFVIGMSVPDSLGVATASIAATMWDDGSVYVAKLGDMTGQVTLFVALDALRKFLHEHGKGPR